MISRGSNYEVKVWITLPSSLLLINSTRHGETKSLAILVLKEAFSLRLLTHMSVGRDGFVLFAWKQLECAII